MNILCFASDPDRLTLLLKAVSGIRSSDLNLELYRSIDELYRKLSKPKESSPIVILYPADKGDLQVILAIREIFTDTKVILVLPDRDKDSIKAAHKIGLRFLAFADEDPAIITMIAEKMCGFCSSKTMQGVVS